MSDKKNETMIDKMRNGVGDSVASTLEGSRVFKNLMNNIDMNKDQEMSYIVDTFNKAKTQVPTDTSNLEKMRASFGFATERRLLTLSGLYNGTLPFYQKHCQSMNLNMLLQGMANKVIDNSLGVEDLSNKTEGGEFEKLMFKSTALFELIEIYLKLYGRALMYVVDHKDNPRNMHFQVLTPLNYAKKSKGNAVEWTIFSPRGTQIVGADREAREVFRVIIRTRIDNKDGTFTFKEKADEYYIKDDERYLHQVITKEHVMQGVNDLMCFEFVNDVLGKSNVQDIIHEVLGSDLNATMLVLEQKYTKVSIHADKGYFNGGKLNAKEEFMIYDTDNDNPDMKPLFEVSQPNIRIKQYQEIDAYYVNKMATDIGMSTTALGFNTVTDRVATATLNAEDKTTETINSAKRDFREQMQTFLDFIYGTGKFNFVLNDYQPQSSEYKAKVALQMGNNASIRTKVKMINPGLTEDEVLEEVVLIKTEQRLPMTTAEQDKAFELGLMNDETVPNRDLDLSSVSDEKVAIE